MNFLARNLAEELLILRIAHQLQMVDCSCASQLQYPKWGNKPNGIPSLFWLVWILMLNDGHPY